jgi:hypothetical protein
VDGLSHPAAGLDQARQSMRHPHDPLEDAGHLEAMAGVPLVRALSSLLADRIDRQMAVVFLLFNLTSAIIFTVCQPVIYRFLQPWLPAATQEDLSQPQFLDEKAANEPRSI